MWARLRLIRTARVRKRRERESHTRLTPEEEPRYAVKVISIGRRPGPGGVVHVIDTADRNASTAGSTFLQQAIRWRFRVELY